MKRLLFILIFSATLFLPVFHAAASAPIKILLVPGHDNTAWGARYGNVKEATMTLAVAAKIYNILKQDKRFDVYITRDDLGYTKEFTDYFANQREAIFWLRPALKMWFIA